MKGLAAGLLIAIMPFSVHAIGSKESKTGGEPVVETVISDELQKKYNAMPRETPPVIVLPALATSEVDAAIAREAEEELHREFVRAGRQKPVWMTAHLSNTFSGNHKAANPFAFMAALRGERYDLTPAGVVRSFIFKSGDIHIFSIAYYSLQGRVYQTRTMRFFRSLDEIRGVVADSVGELYLRLESAAGKGKKKSVVVREFTLEFRRLAELASGEFDFVPVPFTAVDGMPYRVGDDYMSGVLSYQLAASQFFETVWERDFSGYADCRNMGATQAEYVIEGKVILTDHSHLLRISLHNTGSGAKETEVIYPIEDFSLENMWAAYREIGGLLVEYLYDGKEYGTFERIENAGTDFYLNNMFVSRDYVDKYMLPEGRHILWTKKYAPDAAERRYYIIIGRRSAVYEGREGEYVWNLLEK